MTKRLTPTIAPLFVPHGLWRRAFMVADSHRDRGVHWVAASGTGKSLSLGLVAFLDFLRGVPQVLFDPSGQMIDAFLLYVAQCSRTERAALWRRIRYIDMSGRGETVPTWPLLHEYSGDSRQDIADRFLETCRAIDPRLAGASIQGYNALYRVGAPTGSILSSLGLQLDSALDLLNRPEAWEGRLRQAERRFPDARQAVDFFRHTYMPLSKSDRLALSNSYRAKLEPILLDPKTRTMLCSETASVDFGEVVHQSQTVLLDFRYETNQRKRLLKTRWAFDSLLAYIRHRGPGKHRPLAIHFDEITELTNQQSLGEELFARDLDYLLNVLQRNYSCWISAAHQQMWQLGERTQETLMSLGTQIIGAISDMETAESLARRYAPLDPYRVKRWENVWGTESIPDIDVDDRYRGSTTEYFVLEERPVDFPLDEQAFIAARAFIHLRPFEFLVKPRDSFAMKKVSTRRFVGNPWPTDHPRLLAHIRHQLGMRVGAPSLDATTAGGSSVTMGEPPTNENDGEDEQLDERYWDAGPLS